VTFVYAQYFARSISHRYFIFQRVIGQHEQKTSIVLRVSVSKVKVKGVKHVKFVSAQYLANYKFITGTSFHCMIGLHKQKTPLGFGESGPMVKVTGINFLFVSFHYLPNCLSLILPKLWDCFFLGQWVKCQGHRGA